MLERLVLWRRLDLPGHDACRIRRQGTSWILEGTAVFAQQGRPSRLSYEVVCNEDWTSRTAQISGWSEDREIDLKIECDGYCLWTVNDRSVASVEGLVDLDLGFTPATNTNAIRRLDLAVGQRSDSVAAWLDTSDWALKRLEQSYERIAEDRYDYRSKLHGYRADLTTDAFGIVAEYPDLWSQEK
ncbi:MAG: putative glycolipid-binding domain-containing protein [Kiloniellales bacterium]